jgi:choline dehydrogenase-like flavoprotein
MDPKFFTHPYDRRVVIDGLRQTMKLLSAPVYARNTVEKIGPKDESDDSIWDYVKKNTHSSWHMSCTARMGTDSNSACVDSNFRVFGLSALRIVDLSICPFVPK